MIRLFVSCFLALLVTGSSLVLPQETKALSGSQFKAGRIIDDAIFFNPVGMNATQIQSFLNAKVPVCDTNGDKPYAGTTRRAYAASKGVSTPFICLKNYSQNTPERQAESGLCGYLSAKNNRTAAQIIHDVAHACNVNPKVLIVLLQKEQSLITDDWPWPVQYTKATGFACPDTAPCDPAYAGFFYQVHNAARQFKRYSVDSHLFNYRANRNNNILWHPNTGCGSSTVFIQNQATAGLYNYTPYRPNQAALNNLYGTGNSCSSYGNRNFWRMYNDWFGSTHASYIIKGSGSPTLYLQNGDKRHAISNSDILKAYGFDNAPVTHVSSGYVSSLTNAGALTTLFEFEGSNTVRLADSRKQFGIPSSTICDNWGLSCFDSNKVRELPSFLSALIPGGGLVKPVMWTPTGGYFKMQDAKKSPLVGSLSKFGYTANSATPISTPINSGQPYDMPLVANDTLVKFGNSPSIYYHDSGNYYTFPSLSTYNAWAKGFSAIVYKDDKSPLASSPPSSSGNLGTFVHSGATKYFISEGRKFNITSLASDWPSTTNNAFASPMLDHLQTVTVTPNTLFRNISNGLIYQVEDKKYNYFVALRDFYAAGGANKPKHNVSSDITNALTPGRILLGEGSLFKKAGDPSIFAVRAGNATSYGLTDMGQISRLGLAGVKVISVDDDTADAYPVNGSFADLIKVGSNYYILSRNNTKIGFSSTNISRWGGNTSLARTHTSYVSNGIPSSVTDPRFAVHPSGTIYYGYGGQKRPIGSYAKYIQLGGNNRNTFPASSAFLSTLPTGSVMH